MTFWEIAGARHVVFFNTKTSPRSDEQGRRSGECEMTMSWSDHAWIALGSCSECRRIGFFFAAEAIQGFLAEILNSEFRGRRSTW